MGGRPERLRPSGDSQALFRGGRCGWRVGNALRRPRALDRPALVSRELTHRPDAEARVRETSAGASVVERGDFD